MRLLECRRLWLGLSGGGDPSVSGCDLSEVVNSVTRAISLPLPLYLNLAGILLCLYKKLLWMNQIWTELVAFYTRGRGGGRGHISPRTPDLFVRIRFSIARHNKSSLIFGSFYRGI